MINQVIIIKCSNFAQKMLILFTTIFISAILGLREEGAIMLNKIKNTVDKMEEQITEVESVSEEIKENLQKNFGVLPIYREIIASNRRMQTISIITIIFLSILLIINIFVTVHNEKAFIEYRENSISKEDLVTILSTFENNE